MEREGSPVNISEIKPLGEPLRAQIAKAVVGQADTVDLLLIALFAGGHILLEGPPGTAKTLLAQCFARSLGLEFGRIQFTPDLMPGDIIGANLFNFQTSTFTLTRGRSSANCCWPTRSTARRPRPRPRCWRRCRSGASPSTARRMR